MSSRLERSLVRLARLLALAVVPMLLYQLTMPVIDWRAVLMAAITAGLGALLKWAQWDEARGKPRRPRLVK